MFFNVKREPCCTVHWVGGVLLTGTLMAVHSPLPHGLHSESGVPLSPMTAPITAGSTISPTGSITLDPKLRVTPPST